MTLDSKPPLQLLSDHLMIRIDIICDIGSSDKTTNPTCSLNYSKANWEGINQFLSQYNFNLLFSLPDSDTKWAFIKNAILEAVHQFTPCVRSRFQYRPRWFNSEIQHQLNRIHTMRRTARAKPTQYNITKLETAEQQLSLDIQKAKQSFESSLIQNLQSNPTKVYKYISSIKSESQIPSSVYLETCSSSLDEDKAKLFNHYFFSVFTHSFYQLPYLYEVAHIIPNLDKICLNECEVYEALFSLECNKAAGIDSIRPDVLKHCATPLTKPLHHLFCHCISTHDLPSEWRIHCIIPIFKSGNKSNVANYRPISLLCVVSKVLERLVYNHVVGHLTRYISTQQFGFVAGRSSLQQLLLFVNNIIQAKAHSNNVDIIYLDFKKAFDSVPHNELLYKLWKYGITGYLWMWFKAYLSSRMQCVRVYGHLSGLLPVVSGVPQGSILGPLLFVLYINDLPDILSSATPYLFADDTKCLHISSAQSNHTLLQNDIDALTTYSNSWHLLFNEAKCVHLHFQFKSASNIPNYYINDKLICRKEETKDLGIIFNTDLCWDEHHRTITSRAYRCLYLLKRTFTTHAVTSKKLLCISLVRAQLTYCSQLWRPYLIKDIIVLERVQRRATKFILNDYQSSYRSRLLTLNLLPLMYLFEIYDIIFFIKSLKNPTSSFNIYNFIEFHSSSSRLSKANKLTHQRFLNLITRHFFFNRVPRLWNTLPVIDISLPTSVIHSRLNKYFWNHFVNNFDSTNPCTFHLLCPCSRCTSIPRSPNFQNLI